MAFCVTPGAGNQHGRLWQILQPLKKFTIIYVHYFYSSEQFKTSWAQKIKYCHSKYPFSCPLCRPLDPIARRGYTTRPTLTRHLFLGTFPSVIRWSRRCPVDGQCICIAFYSIIHTSVHSLTFNDYLCIASKPNVGIYSRYDIKFKNQLMGCYYAPSTSLWNRILTKTNYLRKMYLTAHKTDCYCYRGARMIHFAKPVDVNYED